MTNSSDDRRSIFFRAEDRLVTALRTVAEGNIGKWVQIATGFGAAIILLYSLYGLVTGDGFFIYEVLEAGLEAIADD